MGKSNFEKQLSLTRELNELNECIEKIKYSEERVRIGFELMGIGYNFITSLPDQEAIQVLILNHLEDRKQETEKKLKKFI